LNVPTCKKNFCIGCCDNEFGVNKQDSRASCKVECIKFEKNKNNETVKKKMNLAKF